MWTPSTGGWNAVYCTVKEHLPLHANGVIIYSGLRTHIACSSFTPPLLHPSIIINGVRYYLCRGFYILYSFSAQMWTSTHTGSFLLIKKNQICSSKGWIIDVMLKKGWNNRSPLYDGGRSNPQLEVGRQSGIGRNVFGTAFLWNMHEQ